MKTELIRNRWGTRTETDRYKDRYTKLETTTVADFRVMFVHDTAYMIFYTYKALAFICNRIIPRINLELHTELTAKGRNTNTL
jgi:hypothetical protein